MTDPRRDRVAKNEALFRSVNERVKEVAEPFVEVGGSSETQRVAFVCECGRSECYETIELTLDEYEHARARPTWFVLVPGHEVADLERVVRQGPGFAIVEKHPEESGIARAADPR